MIPCEGKAIRIDSERKKELQKRELKEDRLEEGNESTGPVQKKFTCQERGLRTTISLVTGLDP